jgi:hypothetical protein
MMKQPLLGAMAFLAVAGSCSAARAVPFDFTYTGSLVTFTVPTTDTYQILAFGAQGGSAMGFGFVGVGGWGVEIAGDFSLTAGTTLEIAVGGYAVAAAQSAWSANAVRWGRADHGPRGALCRRHPEICS